MNYKIFSKLKLEKYYDMFAKILSHILFYKLSFSFSTISTKYCPLSLQETKQILSRYNGSSKQFLRIQNEVLDSK